MIDRDAIVWPGLLPRGSCLGVIAPAGPVPRERLSRGLRALREQGYGVKLGDSVLAKRHYLAGTDEQRLADLHRLWADPEVDAIWCARGGYGTMRLLPDIDWSILQRPIPLIGYSDITALQLALIARTGLVSFSGPMVGTIHGYGADAGIDPSTAACLWQWLLDDRPEQTLYSPGPARPRVLQPGVAEGPLLGGNLSLFAALVGTPYLPDCDGAVLVIEDVGETPYRLDRMLTQLKLAGILDRLSAVLIADFADCYPPRRDEPGLPIDLLVLERLGGRDIPVLSGIAYGHIDRRCTIPLGAWCRVDAGRAEVTIEVGRRPGGSGDE